MIFFDYLYYAICKFYLKTMDSSPEFAAVCICSLLQCAVIFILVEIHTIVIGDKSGLNKFIGLIVMLGSVVFNYLRYIHNENNNYKKIQIKWASQSSTSRVLYRVFLITFAAFTIISALSLTIYVGNMKN